MTTNTPKVLNKHKPEPGRKLRKIYCGRPSYWGNPFRVGEGFLDRGEGVWKFFWHLVETPQKVAKIHELKGCDLECYCAPKACHCDILVQLANNPILQHQFIRHLCMEHVTEQQFNNHRDKLTGEQVRIVQEIMAKVFPSAMQRLINEKEAQAEAEAIEEEVKVQTTHGRDILELMHATGDMGIQDPELETV